MSRFLFVVPPFTGHINPAVGVAKKLESLGHSTAWAGEEGIIRRLAGSEAHVYPCPSPSSREGAVRRPPHLRGFAALQFLWKEGLVPLAEQMAPGVDRAIARFRPDVVVADQQAFAGALTADRLSLPWVTLATTFSELSDSLAATPLVIKWIESLLGALRARIGRADSCIDPRFSPYLVLACTARELSGPPTAGSGEVVFVGASLDGRPVAPAFPWEALDPSRAKVLVTLGTMNEDTGERFLTACCEALEARAADVQGVIIAPGWDRPSPEFGTYPPMLVVDSAPQVSLLARASAVICHAGHNTVCEALWHGVPLVTAPIRDDQPVVSARLVETGAGVRLRFNRASAEQIGRALDAVLSDPAYARNARRLGGALRAAGGAAAAADRLAALAVAASSGSDP
ncbi:glycosyltransferase [Streptomyces sp. NPDC058989]|uniref:glycosyltransferase n=1 Tax=Streptomyces sp. NPDC058989 TaxID=3346686 RepID=UPI0036A19CDB